MNVASAQTLLSSPPSRALASLASPPNGSTGASDLASFFFSLLMGLGAPDQQEEPAGSAPARRHRAEAVGTESIAALLGSAQVLGEAPLPAIVSGNDQPSFARGGDAAGIDSVAGDGAHAGNSELVLSAASLAGIQTAPRVFAAAPIARSFEVRRSIEGRLPSGELDRVPTIGVPQSNPLAARDGGFPSPLAFGLRLREIAAEQSGGGLSIALGSRGKQTPLSLDLAAAAAPAAMLSSQEPMPESAGREMGHADPAANVHRAAAAQVNGDSEQKQPHASEGDVAADAKSSPEDGNPEQSRIERSADPTPSASPGAAATLPLLHDAHARSSRAAVAASREPVENLSTASVPSREISEANPGSRLSTTREISMRIAGAESPSVDVKMVDRGGSIRVAVRTPNAALAQSLQSDLADLVQRLEHKGFQTEAWTPHEILRVGNPGGLLQNTSDSTKNGYSEDPSRQGQNNRPKNRRNRPRWFAEVHQKIANGAVEL